MNQYVTSYVVNTGRDTSVRIITSYYSLTRQQSPKICEKLYIRLGTTVVSISRLPKEDVQTMSRNILIAFLIFQKFNAFRIFDHSARIAAFSLSRFSKLWQKRLSKLSTVTLSATLYPLVTDISKFFHGWHWRIIYSPDVTDMVRQIAASAYSSILLMRDAQKNMAKPA